MTGRLRGGTGCWPWLVVLLGLTVGMAIRWEGYDGATEYAGWTVDGMRYLRHAREAMDGWPQGIDPLRRVGDGVEWTYPPSLLSAGTAWVAQATGWAPATVGGHVNLVLVPVLGALCAWAALALGTGWAGAASAAAVSMAWLALAHRTPQWRMDTDLGIVCLVVALGICAWYAQAGTTRTRRLGAWAGWALCAGLLWWWWDQARTGTGLIALAPLAAAMVLAGRGTRPERWSLGLAGLAIAGAMVWLSPRQGIDLVTWVGAALQGEVPGEEAGWAPGGGKGGAHINELKTVAHWGWWATLPALALLVPGRWRALVVVTGVPLALALGAAWMGSRWLMMWGPVVAWAIAAIATCPVRYAGAACGGAAAAVVLMQLGLWGAGIAMTEEVGREERGGNAWAWETLRATPTDTVVAAIWDRGSRIRAQARRATIADEEHPTRKRAAVGAAAWSARTEQGAWAILRLQVVHGTEGLLATGAGEETGPERLKRAIRRLEMPLDEAAEDLARAPDGPCTTKEACRRWLRPTPERAMVVWVDIPWGPEAKHRGALTQIAARGRSGSGCFTRMRAGKGSPGTTLWRLTTRPVENAQPGACRGRITEPH